MRKGTSALGPGLRRATPQTAAATAKLTTSKGSLASSLQISTTETGAISRDSNGQRPPYSYMPKPLISLKPPDLRRRSFRPNTITNFSRANYLHFLWAPPNFHFHKCKLSLSPLVQIRNSMRVSNTSNLF